MRCFGAAYSSASPTQEVVFYLRNNIPISIATKSKPIDP
jgi:hypothetical protein